MNAIFQNPQKIAEILNSTQVIAVVGLSNNPKRDSFMVASYLKDHGYQIIPVNPNAETIMGEKSYPDLLAIPGDIDVVDVFRKSEDVGPIVDQAIAKGAKTVWMQKGIINEEAAEKAHNAGLDVIMDRCMYEEHKKLHQ